MSIRLAQVLAVPALLLAAPLARAATTEALVGQPVQAVARTVVHMGELARWQALHPAIGPVRPRMNELNEENEENGEFEHEEPGVEEQSTEATPPPFIPFVASPSPTQSFMGLDDIAMVDSNYIVIPPDVGGAVGLTKILQGCNNNYRVLNKADGSVVSTVGTATFWNGTGATLNTLSDPRTIYDPYNNRWITCMISDFSSTLHNSSIEIGISQTSDPNGAWYLFRSVMWASSTVSNADYPILGFNKNWVTITVNMYNQAGTSFSGGKVLMMYYPDLRNGVFTAFTVTRTGGAGFCAAPCVTYSPTSDTTYVVQHMSSGSATYGIDKITGLGPGAPTYSVGASQIRTGGGWVAPGGNLQPQSAPNSGTSACGGTPCPAETQDAYVRSSPVYRGGFIYYAQTVGLPAGTMTHTGAQWTKLNTPTGTFADGGRLEDPTATSSNGGKWYDNVHIAVNAAGDFMVGFTQFSSAQHPAAGYAMHMAADGAGTIRDALIYHAGDDYYHKTFSTTTGRNRWGDFSTAQVDPSDDQTLWTVQEYGKTRPGTDDGNTGSNSSRWSTWWAAVGPAVTFTITASAGPNGSIAPSGAVIVSSGANQSFTITPNASYHVADVLVDGVSVGAVTNYSFTNVTANHTISASFAINTYTITASAGANGSIAPSGAVVVNSGASQGFTITPSASYHVADVLVDGVSVGAVTTYTFTNVTANHTISASFAIDTYTITATAGANGSIAPSGAVVVNAGASQGFTITPSVGYHVQTVTVDGVPVGAVTTYTFTNVLANHTIHAIFNFDIYTITATAGPNGSIAPSGAVPVGYGGSQAFTITPDAGYHVADVLVDGASVGAVTAYTFTNVTANHTIDASFAIDTYTITAGAGANGSIAPSGAVVVTAGASQGFTITPDASYHVLDVLVDGASVGAVTTYTFTNVLANHTIDASFSIDTYTITATAGAGGSITPSGAVIVNTGADQGFTIAADPGYHIVDVLVDGVSAGAVTTYTFTNVTAAHTIDASFAIDTFTITATAGANGSIAPSGAVSVNSGADQAFTITPDAGYHVLDVLVDATTVGAVTDYTFTNVTADHTIDASFEADATGIAEMHLPAPTRLSVAAALPNPFARRIDFLIGTPTARDATVTIWDGGGRLVATIAAQKPLAAGYTAFSWNGENAQRRPAAGGVYILRVDAGRERSTRSIVKLR